jgi:hypothetical protein
MKKGKKSLREKEAHDSSIEEMRANSEDDDDDDGGPEVDGGEEDSDLVVVEEGAEELHDPSMKGSENQSPDLERNEKKSETDRVDHDPEEAEKGRPEDDDPGHPCPAMDCTESKSVA